MKDIVVTDNAPKAIGPYSQAVIAGGFVFVSGQLPVDPDTGLIPEDIERQTYQSLENIKAILEVAGASMEDVVKTTVFLADMGQFQQMNGIYEDFFSAEAPARACVQVAALPKGALVEIEAIAVLKWM